MSRQLLQRTLVRRAFFLFATLVVLGGILPAQDSRRRGQRAKPAAFEGKVAFAEAPSKLLGRDVRHLVYTPKGYDAPENARRRYPVLYFLHGLFESAERWDSRGGSEMIDAAIRRQVDHGIMALARRLDGRQIREIAEHRSSTGSRLEIE